MLKRILVICGPTATGKTELTLYLAKKYNGEVISADSRQVYSGMDIGTGKEVPKGFGFKTSGSAVENNDIGYYTDGDVKIWGYDLVEPDEDFSVSGYCEIMMPVVKDIWKLGKLPIITGGTGFYIKALIDGVDTISVKPDLDLRKKLAKKSSEELLVLLKRLDLDRVNSMNFSDRKNPRRLVRAIEVSLAEDRMNSGSENSGGIKKTAKLSYDNLLMIGLTGSKEILGEKIKKRVDMRLKLGFESEILKLIRKGIDWKYKSMQATGYRQYEDYYIKKVSKEGFKKLWISEEMKYVKRQMTWFKKEPRIIWFDISGNNLRVKVENITKNWYYGS